ncbi:MAG: RecBCD enzyme subunit RecB [Chlamydiales bacterium]|nr:RecBCD enzyme subunit RecB [Chlamydiales bacterium]MCH9619536.1 RecBCD enzyme subunit RecB [Chlamydiales bacterium]MCH9623142.1 RecBCD enzyme subunit RecB [Chlamydiales bacterium]
MRGSELLSDHFIEASAGTGKTYTIETIVARLIEEEGLKLDEILVVTFTRAATFELKNRIRKKVESLDDEKIFTIHSFCFHTLREHAFDSGISLDQMEENHSDDVLKQTVKDYFRTHTLDEKQLEIILRSHQNSLDTLVDHLVYIGKQRIPIECIDPIPLPQFNPDHLLEDLIALAPLYGKMCDRQKNLKRSVIDGFKRFITGDVYDTPLLLMTPKNRLKKGAEPTLHYPGLLDQLVECVKSMTDPLYLFARLAEEIRKKIEEVIEQRELVFFEDLIRLMEENMENETFVKKVRGHYKAVLIDEFQDTDPKQWKIFKRLFLGEVPLYLVGDPKQAIYRFRQADLYTYMEAKKEVGNCSVLEKNFRSTGALLGVLNHLFSQTTFALPRTSETLVYTPVEAGMEKEELLPPVFLLKAKDETELFKKVVEQIDLNLTTAVLVKDRFQAARFQQFCPYPTHLSRGRVLHPTAFKVLKELLAATLDPYDRNGAQLVVGGPLSDLDSKRFMEYHTLLEERGILYFFKHITTLSGKSLIEKGGEELYLDLLQLVEMLAEKRLPKDGYLTYLQELELSDEERRKARPLEKEGAISVMTVYGSKGLEFDVVFPIGLALPQTATKGLIYSFEKQTYCFQDPHHEAENDAELIRQIYVGFTRAKKRLYIPLIEKKRSPLSQFLEGIEHTLPEPSHPPFAKEFSSPKMLKEPRYFTLDFPSCPITSFSSLMTYEPGEKKELPTDLPAGPEVGTLLHKVLEVISFQKVDSKRIQRILKNTLLEEYTGWVVEMCNRVSKMVFPGSFSLSDVDPQKMLPELEFLYPTDEGYMKGFIDLFFEHHDRYYIIDWKSNVITDTLEKEMERHHYFLQAEIYKNAVQKFTRLFPPKEIGGIFYLFLREENGLFIV